MNWGWFVAALSLIMVNSRIVSDLGFTGSDPDFWIMTIIPTVMFIFGMNHGRAILRERERKEKDNGKTQM